MKRRNAVLARLKVVIGYRWVQVVDVVEADITGKPIQDGRKTKIRRALERCREPVPFGVTHPACFVRAMLHGEHPGPDDCRKGYGRKLHDKDICVSEHQTQAAQSSDQAKRCEMEGEPFVPPRSREIEGRPVEQGEDDWRQNDVSKNWVAGDAVPDALTARHGVVLGHRNARRVDVGGLAAIQIVPGVVVPGVLPPPRCKRSHCQEAACHTDYCVGSAATKERPVTAIMLDDKDAHEKAAG